MSRQPAVPEEQDPLSITSEQQRQQHDDVEVLIHALNDERTAAKEKEQREAWTKYVSLMVVAFAVVTAIATLRAGQFGTRAILHQALASDQWAYYQAKGIKGRISELEQHLAPAEKAKKLGSEVERYKMEQKEIFSEAKRLEDIRLHAAKHGPPLGNAIAFLQISIALASICLLTKKKALWYFAGACGLGGVVLTVYGLWMVEGVQGPEFLAWLLH